MRNLRLDAYSTLQSNPVVPRGNRYKSGHMKTCPTKWKSCRISHERNLDSVGQTELADKLLGSQRVIMTCHKTETKPHDGGEQTNRCLSINDRLIGRHRNWEAYVRGKQNPPAVRNTVPLIHGKYHR